MDGHPLREARASSVRFSDVTALDGVSAAFGAGELVFDHGRKVADGTPHEVRRYVQPIHSEPPAGGINPKEPCA